ncbi:hypothetical protein LP419_01860 [Massilia sp. H-1]|nr:hypothetical protein LP419_01860 [Massilia sp. H-1]
MEIDAADALPSEAAAPAAPQVTLLRPSLAAWLGEGARTLLLRQPRWDRLDTGPAFLALMVVLGMAAAIGTGRLEIDGDATFYWRASLTGWAAFVITAWACYVVRPRPDLRADSAVAPAAAHLLTMIAVQSLLLQLSLGVADALARRAGLLDNAANWLLWLVWLLPTLWSIVAMVVLLMRSGDRALSQRVQACYAMCAAAALTIYFAPVTPFWQDQAGDAEDAYKPIRISQELVENQLPLMDAQLDALAPQRPRRGRPVHHHLRAVRRRRSVPARKRRGQRRDGQPFRRRRTRRAHDQSPRAPRQHAVGDHDQPAARHQKASPRPWTSRKTSCSST